ncbi:ArsR family transcriptional regulator [Natronococcus pandeyae]|uniref:ArsR family transcriptional regulator n=1 Tax=Natronococcus pandeyae TaxID=2055836 RepID=A0A8J8TQ30_9EURY|nr:helix-turn-helix domain-containing protein [Natronococcus pandeyae]TYL36475.1 ArsR family transcriptional regulator [Natronococcus pandeyae]
MSNTSVTLSARDDSPTARPARSDRQTADPQAILAALDDADCRDILEETADESLTASELSDRCDVPLSTLYRKLELLAEAGLVEERIQIRKNGKHTSEYRQDFDDITLSVTDESQVAVSVSQLQTERTIATR